jgi:hypothetical protein
MTMSISSWGGSLAIWKLLAAVAVSALGLAGTPARADFVTATFSNVNPGEVVTIPVGTGTESGWAGVYNFTNASGAIAGSFSGFCIDIAQNIFANQTVTFGVAALSSAPVDGIQPSPMGTLRANLIGELWFNDQSLIGTSNSNAAAFQIAIWEIINEKNTNQDGTLDLNINSGSFYALAHDGTTLTTANTWLSQLNLAGTGSTASNLMALTSLGNQDYVFQGPPSPGPDTSAAPAPSGLVLCFIGIIALMLSSAFRTYFRVSSAICIEVGR